MPTLVTDGAAIPPGVTDPAAVRLGGILRRHREAQGISLRVFARRCELSPAHVSKVERGLASPSIITLSRMVSELGIDGADLFGATRLDGGGALLVRAAEVPCLQSVSPEAPDGTCIRLIAKTSTSTVILARGGSPDWIPMVSAPNESVVHILDGSADAEVDGQVFALEAGDVLTIPALVPHRMRVTQGIDTRMLIITGSATGVVPFAAG